MCIRIPRSTVAVLLILLSQAWWCDSTLAEPLGPSADALELRDESSTGDQYRKPFELDSVPVDIRVATRGSDESFGDVLRGQFPSEKESNWDEMFEMTVDGDLKSVAEDRSEEMGLLPFNPSQVQCTFELSEDACEDEKVVVATPLNRDPGAMDLLFEELAERDEPKSKKTLPVRPEPSGWNLMAACVASLLVISCCTRWLRPSRDRG